jgi:hypothetical protein
MLCAAQGRKRAAAMLTRMYRRRELFIAGIT